MKKLHILLGCIQLFVALGAIVPGLLMLTDPSGESMGMPLELLQNSPFKNYLIPGLFLFTVNGLCNLIATVLSFKKYKFSALIGLLLGISLTLWIGIQVYYITLNNFLQPLFFITGIAEIIVSLLLLSRKKKEL